MNGVVTLSGLSVGNTANYTCDAGFFVNGTEIRACQGLEWNSSAPTCGELIVTFRLHFSILDNNTDCHAWL